MPMSKEDEYWYLMQTNRLNERKIASMARELVRQAELLGVVVTIETEPYKMAPLRMGHHHAKIEVRMDREHYRPLMKMKEEIENGRK